MKLRPLAAVGLGSAVLASDSALGGRLVRAPVASEDGGGSLFAPPAIALRDTTVADGVVDAPDANSPDFVSVDAVDLRTGRTRSTPSAASSPISRPRPSRRSRSTRDRGPAPPSSDSPATR